MTCAHYDEAFVAAGEIVTRQEKFGKSGLVRVVLAFRPSFDAAI
jgi:hypothetical protein